MVNLFMEKFSAETVWETYVFSGELKKNDIKWFVVGFSWFFVCSESYLAQKEVVPITKHMVRSCVQELVPFRIDFDVW